MSSTTGIPKAVLFCYLVCENVDKYKFAVIGARGKISAKTIIHVINVNKCLSLNRQRLIINQNVFVVFVNKASTSSLIKTLLLWTH